MKTEEHEFSQIGGARIDIFNATWPFARLSVKTTSVTLETGGRRNWVETGGNWGTKGNWGT
jgi:hypothetical protein